MRQSRPMLVRPEMRVRADDRVGADRHSVIDVGGFGVLENDLFVLPAPSGFHTLLPAHIPGLPVGGARCQGEREGGAPP